MKRWMIPVGIAIIILIAFTVFSFLPRPLERVCNLDVTKDTKLFCVDGTTGETLEVTDSDEIQRLFSLLEKATVTKQMNQEPRAGYTFALTKYEGDKRIFSIIIAGTTVHVNNVYYTVDTDLVAVLRNSGTMMELVK